MFHCICNCLYPVGYNTLNLGFAHQMMGVSFEDVATGEGMYLKDVKGSFEAYDELQFSFDDENSIIDFNVYQYLNESEGFEDGWYDGDYQKIDDSVQIPVGSAVWLNSSATDTTIAGAVPQGTKTYTFKQVHNMICGAYPVPFNPNDTRFGWNGVEAYDEIQVAFDDENGIIDFDVYQYLNESEGFEDGWYDGDYQKVEAPIAAVGQGFWINLSNYENVAITEAAPAGL